MTAYYNEHDPNAAAWLRELIKDGLISDGEVDERSIEDVLPADVAGFTRCHFFAGIGVWDYALRLAGWPDDRQVWTGSCPCPPFSTAGKKKACPECGGTNPVPHVGRTGFFVCCLCDHEWLADARHLWPEMWRLIRDGRPGVFFGEQVAGKDGLTWFASVRASLEILSYSSWGFDLPVAGFGAPHRRQRLFFVADTASGKSENGNLQRGGKHGLLAEGDGISFVADPEHSGHDRQERIASVADRNEPTERLLDGDSTAGRVVNPELRRPEQWYEAEWSVQEPDAGRADGRMENPELSQGPRLGQHGGEVLRDEEPDGPSGAGVTNGFWSDTAWVYCNDPRTPKWRPTKPGIFPLADRTPGRVALLRGAGNAISPWVAKAFIESYMKAGMTEVSTANVQ